LKELPQTFTSEELCGAAKQVVMHIIDEHGSDFLHRWTGCDDAETCFTYEQQATSGQQCVVEFVSVFMRRIGGHVLSRMTGGRITEVPGSIEDAKLAFLTAFKNEIMFIITKYTGIEELTGSGPIGTPNNATEFKAFMKEVGLGMAGKLLHKYTNGIVSHMPTSREDGCELAKDIYNSQGKDFALKWTGLDMSNIDCSAGLSQFQDKELRRTVMSTLLNLASEFLSKVTQGVVTSLVFTGSWKDECLGVEAQTNEESDIYAKCHQPCGSSAKCGVPTSEGEIAGYFFAIMQRQALQMLYKFTGITVAKVPSSANQLKEMLQGVVMSMIKNKLSEITRGKIDMVPTSLNVAKAMAERMIQKAGKRYLKKYTGLEDIPQTEAEFKQMVMTLLMKAVFIEIPKQLGIDLGPNPTVPKDAEEAIEFIKSLIIKKGQKYLKRFTGLDTLPKKWNNTVKRRLAEHFYNTIIMGNWPANMNKADPADMEPPTSEELGGQGPELEDPCAGDNPPWACKEEMVAAPVCAQPYRADFKIEGKGEGLQFKFESKFIDGFLDQSSISFGDGGIVTTNYVACHAVEDGGVYYTPPGASLLQEEIKKRVEMSDGTVYDMKASQLKIFGTGVVFGAMAEVLLVAVTDNAELISRYPTWNFALAIRFLEPFNIDGLPGIRGIDGISHVPQLTSGGTIIIADAGKERFSNALMMDLSQAPGADAGRPCSRRLHGRSRVRLTSSCPLARAAKSCSLRTFSARPLLQFRRR
jgi:hypothetical protein